MTAYLLAALAWGDPLIVEQTHAGVGAPAVEIVDRWAYVDGVRVLRPIQRVFQVEGVPRLETRERAVPPVTRAPRTLDATQALARVTALGTPGSQGATQAELVAVPGPRETRFAWRVDPPVDRATLRNPVFLVDAHDGRVREDHDATHHALARVYPRNPVLDATPEDVELLTLEAEAQTLEGPTFVAFNCVDPPSGGTICDPAHIAVPDTGGDFLYDPVDIEAPTSMADFEDAFAEVSAYAHADAFEAYLDGFGVPLSPCEPEGEQLTLVANYKGYDNGVALAVDNAAYTGDCEFTVALGQGKDVDWGYDGDVVTHELTHGVIQHLMGRDRPLRLSRHLPHAISVDAAGMNEAIADFVSNAYMGDPVHGDYVSTYGPGSGRDASNGYTCPAGLVGEEHYDAEPFGGALWDGFEALGEPFVGVVLDAVGMFETDATFDEAAGVLVAVTEAELGSDAAQTVQAIMHTRRMTRCERVVAWDALERDELWILPKGFPEGFDPMRPPPFQIRVDVPEDANRVEMSFDLRVITPAMWEPLADLNVLVKHDEPIEFTYTPDAEDDSLTHVGADSEAHIPGLNAGTASFSVEPGRPVYLALFNLGLHVAVVSNLSVGFSWEEGQDSDGETEGASEGGSDGGPGSDTGDTEGDSDGFAPAPEDPGCGCTQRPSDSAPRSWGWLLPALLPLGRRRRGPGVTGSPNRRPN